MGGQAAGAHSSRRANNPYTRRTLAVSLWIRYLSGTRGNRSIRLASCASRLAWRPHSAKSIGTASYIRTSSLGMCSSTTPATYGSRASGLRPDCRTSRQAPAPPEIIAGTLAYMSPEQTGRMNRSIDTRSDLYSLGVTLYQMLTGALPFAAADPLEWVHCHIARQPVPPGDRAAVPELLSAIIMKLLAKNAEERYQTACGPRSRSSAVPGGMAVAWPHRSIRSGRARLLGPVADPGEAVRTGGRDRRPGCGIRSRRGAGTPQNSCWSPAIPVSGSPRSCNELHKVLVPPRGLFASGKFDQYKRDIPYATLAQAFQTLVRQVLVKNDAELGPWRHALP